MTLSTPTDLQQQISHVWDIAIETHGIALARDKILSECGTDVDSLQDAAAITALMSTLVRQTRALADACDLPPSGPRVVEIPAAE